MAYLLIWLLSLKLGWLPVQGYERIAKGVGPWLRQLILPSITLSVIYIALIARVTRASVLETLGEDYIRTARAKGLADRVVLYKHALRNAMLPMVTMLGLQFGNVLAGAILVETVFNWPGLGRLASESVLRRDYPTILGVLLFSSMLVVIMNLVTDYCYRLIDPRIKSS
jgi:peptide/nickel transport system permease protein